MAAVVYVRLLFYHRWDQKRWPISSYPLLANSSARDETHAPSKVVGQVFLIHPQSLSNHFRNSALFSAIDPSGRRALSSMCNRPMLSVWSTFLERITLTTSDSK